MSARKPLRSALFGLSGAATGVIAIVFGTGHGFALTAEAVDANTTQPSTSDALDALLNGDGSQTGNTSSPDATTSADGLGSGSGNAQQTPSNTPTPQPSKTATQRPTPTRVNGAFLGDVSYLNRYGPCQVKITVTDGRITDSQLVVMPRDLTSQRISTQAAAYLRQEVLAAQSASISWIGGASLTSPAYIESLSSAVAKAHL